MAHIIYSLQLHWRQPFLSMAGLQLIVAGQATFFRQPFDTGSNFGLGSVGDNNKLISKISLLWIWLVIERGSGFGLAQWPVNVDFRTNSV